MRSIHTKIEEIAGGKQHVTELPGKKSPKMFGLYITRMSSSPEIPENAIPFTIRNFRKFKLGKLSML